MAKKSKAKSSSKNRAGLKTAVALAATFLVVIGVAGVAVLANRPTPNVRDSASSEPQAAKTSGPEQALLQVAGADVKLVSLANENQRAISWPDDVSRLGTALSLLQGADARSGQVIWLDPGFVRASSTAIRAPDGRRTAWLGSDKRDGGTTVFVQYGREVRTYTLRQSNGKKISNVQLIGWTGPQNIAFMGAATSSNDIYLLDTDGSIVHLAQLPDQAWMFRAGSDAVWYATAETGEGIESAQKPPSSIWRVGADARIDRVVYEPEKVITSFVVDQDSVAYVLDDNTLKTVAVGREPRELGHGTPLLIRQDKGVLVKQQNELVMIREDGITVRRPLADPDAAVFYVDSAKMDDAASAK